MAAKLAEKWNEDARILRDRIVEDYGISAFLDTLDHAPVVEVDGKLEVRAGVWFAHVCDYLADKATRTNQPITVIFNERAVTAYPGDTAAEISIRWDTARIEEKKK